MVRWKVAESPELIGAGQTAWVRLFLLVLPVAVPCAPFAVQWAKEAVQALAALVVAASLTASGPTARN
eukprot:m.162914 g.162914  ORF g.162914 m.162914 type:complete len:68 (-) comp21018_c0_seq1:46-249(-)